MWAHFFSWKEIIGITISILCTKQNTTPCQNNSTIQCPGKHQTATIVAHTTIQCLYLHPYNTVMKFSQLVQCFWRSMGLYAQYLGITGLSWWRFIDSGGQGAFALLSFSIIQLKWRHLWYTVTYCMYCTCIQVYVPTTHSKAFGQTISIFNYNCYIPK